MKCHDLCMHTPPPSNMVKLLGLGNKFCMQSKPVNEKQFYLMLERFKCNARAKNYVLLHYGKPNEPAPELFIKNNNLDMIAANNIIECTINRFLQS